MRRSRGRCWCRPWRCCGGEVVGVAVEGFHELVEVEDFAGELVVEGFGGDVEGLGLVDGVEVVGQHGTPSQDGTPRHQEHQGPGGYWRGKATVALVRPSIWGRNITFVRTMGIPNMLLTLTPQDVTKSGQECRISNFLFNRARRVAQSAKMYEKWRFADCPD